VQRWRSSRKTRATALGPMLNRSERQ
jgi:hypothetical protein